MCHPSLSPFAHSHSCTLCLSLPPPFPPLPIHSYFHGHRSLHNIMECKLTRASRMQKISACRRCACTCPHARGGGRDRRLPCHGCGCTAERRTLTRSHVPLPRIDHTYSRIASRTHSLMRSRASVSMNAANNANVKANMQSGNKGLYGWQVKKNAKTGVRREARRQ